MTALVIAEHDNQFIYAATLSTVTAAVQCDGEVHMLVAGSTAASAASAAAKIVGVSKVLLADAPHLDNVLAENVTEQVLAIASSYSHILAPATPYGKNILPRVAARLDVAQILEISRVEATDIFERPIYAGNAIATVKSIDKIKVITVRGTAFDAAAAEGGSATVESLSVVEDQGVSQIVSREMAKRKSWIPNMASPIRSRRISERFQEDLWFDPQT
jgi:electron transfer flavoprotein alpha subunit